MPQDMPPTGGYGPVQYKRNLPARGFRPSVYLGLTVAVMTYGFYRYGIGVRERKYVEILQILIVQMLTRWLSLVNLLARRCGRGYTLPQLYKRKRTEIRSGGI